MTLTNCSFIFIRHGRTDWSKNDIGLGPIDGTLNDLGIQDAYTAAKIMEGVHKFKIYSSTLQRAQETAQIIAKYHCLDIQYISNLRERYYGDYRLVHGSDDSIIPDAESDIDFNTRVELVIKDILQHNINSEYIPCIVSHGQVFKQLCDIYGLSANIGYGEVVRFIPDIMSGWKIERMLPIN